MNAGNVTPAGNDIDANEHSPALAGINGTIGVNQVMMVTTVIFLFMRSHFCNRGKCWRSHSAIATPHMHMQLAAHCANTKPSVPCKYADLLANEKS